MSPLVALPPRPVPPVARPAVVCFGWPVARFDRELRIVLARVRLRFPRGHAVIPQLAVPLVCLLERRPFSVAHWLPNMPRGSEDPLRGGGREINAARAGLGRSSPTDGDRPRR